MRTLLDFVAGIVCTALVLATMMGGLAYFMRTTDHTQIIILVALSVILAAQNTARRTLTRRRIREAERTIEEMQR